MAGGTVGVVAGVLAGYLFYRGFYPTCGYALRDIGDLPCRSAGHPVTGDSAEQLKWMTGLAAPLVATGAGAVAGFIVGKYRGTTGRA